MSFPKQVLPLAILAAFILGGLGPLGCSPKSETPSPAVQEEAAEPTGSPEPAPEAQPEVKESAPASKTTDTQAEPSDPAEKSTPDEGGDQTEQDDEKVDNVKEAFQYTGDKMEKGFKKAGSEMEKGFKKTGKETKKFFVGDDEK